MKNERLQILRMTDGKNIRQDALSKRLGFGANYYAKVENGKQKGSIKFWEKIQQEFNIPPEAMWDVITNRKEGI